MIDIMKLLYEICEDDCVYDPEYDLIENGILDSFAFIELFSRLEDYGVDIQPTQIDRNLLRTSRGIQEMVNNCCSKK